MPTIRTPFHVRAFDKDGNTTYQSPTGFKTVDDAKDAIKKLDRMRGEDHVVCVSLDPKSPRNKPADGEEGAMQGFAVYDPKIDGPGNVVQVADEDEDEDEAPKPAKRKAKRKAAPTA